MAVIDDPQEKRRITPLRLALLVLSLVLFLLGLVGVGVLLLLPQQSSPSAAVHRETPQARQLSREQLHPTNRPPDR